MEFDARIKEPDKVGWECKVIIPDGETIELKFRDFATIPGRISIDNARDQEGQLWRIDPTPTPVERSIRLAPGVSAVAQSNVAFVRSSSGLLSGPRRPAMLLRPRGCRAPWRHGRRGRPRGGRLRSSAGDGRR